MLKILIFVVVTFFFVLGLLTAFVFIYLKLCAPSAGESVFIISLFPSENCVLELKWLISVFTLFGVQDRIFLRLSGEYLSEEEKKEITSVFSGSKNVFIDEKPRKN